MASSAVKFGLGGVLLMVVAVGGELLYLHHKRAEDDALPKTAEYHTDPDNLVYVKAEHPMVFKDAKDMKGRTVWISAGDQMVYYPYAGHIDFAHQQGMLLGAEQVLVKDAVEQKATQDRFNRIPLGDKQVFVLFTKPKSTDPAKEYAVPVGFKQGGDYTFSTDDIFFYEDPHKLFGYWSPDVWKAIDEHKAILGMNERQAQTALGQVSVPHGDSAGNRMVSFDNQGKPVNITFVNDKATKIDEVK